MSASDPELDHLLVVIDPVARSTDGESVRIAKDVLSAGAAIKMCLPDDPAEFARAVRRRGARRLVVVGDDHALLRAVTLLQDAGELASCALSLVPVGTTVSLAHSLGVPAGAVAAARAVLAGAERRLDLLVDDCGGVVVGGLHIYGSWAPRSAAGGWQQGADDWPGDRAGWLRHCHSLMRTIAARRGLLTEQSARRWGGHPAAGPAAARLRVEADGVTLVDVDQPLDAISLAPADGLARIEIHPASDGTSPPTTPVRVQAQARTITVSGPDFHYRADTLIAGPVASRTWTARKGGWGLTLPRNHRASGTQRSPSGT